MGSISTSTDDTVPLSINNRHLPIPSDPDRLFDVVSSSSGQVVHRAHSATAEEAIQAVCAAEAAFRTWRNVKPAGRRDVLLRVAGIYEREMTRMAALAVQETNCSRQFAEYNVVYAVQSLKELASATAELRGTIPPSDSDDVLALVVKEPVGPLLIIPPWNGVIILATRALGMAIGAGCTVVMKASELCPRTHQAIADAFVEAGLPEGVLNRIQVRREDAAEVTEAIIAHKAIRKVDFIGSAAVGRMIGQTCAKYLKPILMELGGKGPAIVLEDANLEQAAKLCAQGAIMHHGQLCFSTERIIVVKSVSEKFVELLKDAMSAHKSAGVAVNETGAKHAYDVLVDAKENGAEFLLGGPEYGGRASLKPTLVTNVTPKARIWDEETFGPSASVYVVEDEAAAIERANDSVYGLNAAVHSVSWERAVRVARQLEYAQVEVNNMTVNDQVPWPIGGVKGSGWGRSNSKWGLEEFTIEKTIALHGAGAKVFGS